MRRSQKIEKKNHFVSANLKNEKQQWDNFSNFVAFSQYLNFKNQNQNTNSQIIYIDFRLDAYFQMATKMPLMDIGKCSDIPVLLS